MTGVSEVLAAASAALSDAHGHRLAVRRVATLKSSPRTMVLRAAVTGGSDDTLPSTVIIKAHLYDGPWATSVREPAGLGLLTSYGVRPVVAPDLLAVADDPPLVVLRDLSPTGSVRDLAALLLGADRVAAEDGLLAWADTVGRLHAATSGCRDEMTDALAATARRLGREAPPTDEVPDSLDRAAACLADLLPRLGVTPTAAALAELRHLQDGFGGGDRCWALTPGDTCPDNNVLTDAGVVLFDFEGAAIRHVAWDASYLRVPWPSCWCAWRLPEDVAHRGLDRWRAAVVGTVPYVATPAFEADLERAESGWAAVSTGWFLAGALDGDDVPGGKAGRRVAPGRRALILNRLARAARGTVPGLAAWRALAAETRAAAEAAWGPVELAPAPAFRRDTR
ncbi:MAG TPA: hypothetical protein VH857_04265 [Actinomycetes bacterium]|nr:hypothetical protein [Actinomycetes bacterium]